MARLMSSDISVEFVALQVAFNRLTYGAKKLDEIVVTGQQEIANTLYSLGLLSASITVREALWQYT
jgi:hypothetical protein